MLIIDGNSILNRAYYGIRPLTNKDGLYTHAVYGMVSMIQKQMDGLKPDYCVVAFDLKAPTFRHKMYDGYKATRKGMPQELAAQLPYAKECMKNIGFTVLELEGYEADDILGTVSAKAEADGVKAYLLTGDRDSLQLVSDKTRVLLSTTKMGGPEIVVHTPESIFEKYGVSPKGLIEIKALQGDSSDNIPGVAGVGEKTAADLISRFNTIDNIYENIDSLDIKENLKVK